MPEGRGEGREKRGGKRERGEKYKGRTDISSPTGTNEAVRVATLLL